MDWMSKYKKTIAILLYVTLSFVSNPLSFFPIESPSHSAQLLFSFSFSLEMPFSSCILASLALLSAVHAYYNGITTQERVEEIEHVMVDNGGFNSDGAFNAITPCSNYFSPGGPGASSQDKGEQTTAEWVRIVFHDFVTGDTSSGLGGNDASIGLKLLFGKKTSC